MAEGEGLEETENVALSRAVCSGVERIAIIFGFCLLMVSSQSERRK